MPVPYCHVCRKKPHEQSRGDPTLDRGDYCPVCHQPACRYHMGRVRWRWKADNRLDSALVCIECKNSYSHRHWDSHNRDWID